MAAKLINITAGPSKFDLQTALFVRKPDTHCVEFTTEDGRIFDAIISSVGIEDGSGESWLIEGYASPKEVGGPMEDDKSFHAWFRTDNRRGWIKFREARR